MLIPVLQRNEDGGFTLVELLIVIAIIAILAAIAIPQFTKYRLRGYITQLDSDIKNAYSAAQAYLIDNHTESVNSIDKLHSGGFRLTSNVIWVTGDMNLNAGQLELKMVGTPIANNNAVVFYNGRINSGSIN